MFEGFGKNSKKREPDCYCEMCDRWIHHLGIMSHRAMHRRKKEDCSIEFSDGRVIRYKFSKES